MIIFKKPCLILFVTGFFLSNAGSVLAVPVTYEFSGIVDGSIGLTDLQGNFFLITLSGDTDNIISSGSRLSNDAAVTATIDLMGIGTADFLIGTRVFLNDRMDVIGFSRAGLFGTDLLDIGSSVEFDGYDLASNLGPVAAPLKYTGQWDTSSPNAITTLGLLIITDATKLTFTAIVNEVPEPATFALMGLGLAVLGFSRKRKVAQQ